MLRIFSSNPNIFSSPHFLSSLQFGSVAFLFFSRLFFPPRHLLLAEQVAEIQQVGKKERRQIVKTLIMCINDTELEPRKEETIEEDTNSWTLPLPSQLVTTHMENSPNSTLPFPLESISEDTTVIIDEESTVLPDFLPTLRSGEWSDIGRRPYMEDTHICISDLAKNFGYDALGNEVVSFYGVFDGHGGKAAANFVRDHLPRVIVEDADFPRELEKVVTRSFLKTDTAFEKSCSQESTLSSGTTALTAMIFGRSLLVANAGDCRAVLSRRGIAIEMSKDHRPCCVSEKTRVESLGGYIEDGYLNGQLGVTRALGDWHLDGLKQTGPLCADPELKLITLNKEDEFLIIGSDGIWDVFSSQNAIDFARRRLQVHNDVKLCCEEVVEEAIRRRGTDNLTAVMVCFNLEPPPSTVVEKTRFRRTISAEGFQSIMSSLDG